MEFSRYLDCLSADFARLRAAVAADPGADVPTCPGWTAADLARHVGQVYMHKTLGMRLGHEPEDWPPKSLADEEPLDLLDRTYAELRVEFAARNPADPTGTWYEPDQTVGFWIRRMAQETVVHRIDGELAAGRPLGPIPDDLAIDGVDELLRCFVAFGVSAWSEYFTEALAGSPGRVYAFHTDAAAWHVHTAPGTFEVHDGAPETADVTISGAPAELLRWVWNRHTPQNPVAVTVQGPQDALDELHRCIVIGTQ